MVHLLPFSHPSLPNKHTKLGCENRHSITFVSLVRITVLLFF